MCQPATVRAVLAAVEAGNADAGIVYRTDVAIATGAHLAVETPVGEGPEIRYPAAIVTDAPNEDAAPALSRIPARSFGAAPV